MSLLDRIAASAAPLHRVRDLLVRQRTQLINAIRGHLAEFGLIEVKGPCNLPLLLAAMEEVNLPELARGLVRLLAGQLDEVEQRIEEADAQIMACHKANPVSQWLATIPGIAPLVATAIAATITDLAVFRSGREFAWTRLATGHTDMWRGMNGLALIPRREKGDCARASGLPAESRDKVRPV